MRASFRVCVVPRFVFDDAPPYLPVCSSNQTQALGGHKTPPFSRSLSFADTKGRPVRERRSAGCTIQGACWFTVCGRDIWVFAVSKAEKKYDWAPLRGTRESAGPRFQPPPAVRRNKGRGKWSCWRNPRQFHKKRSWGPFQRKWIEVSALHLALTGARGPRECDQLG